MTSKLLSTKLCNLNLKLEENKSITTKIRKLQEELKNRGFKKFFPKFYIGDEWFNPSNSISISIPFFLCHPKLKKLEKSIIGHVEGASTKNFMKLIRHEVGHCIEYAYQLSKSSEWKKIFGNPKKKYDVDNYLFNKNSTDFVINLEDYYAQAHPEEDFAETFAVWLEHERNTWKKLYKKWPKALEKLEYIDKISCKIKDLPPLKQQTSQLANINRLRITLKTYYNMKKDNKH